MKQQQAVSGVPGPARSSRGLLCTLIKLPIFEAYSDCPPANILGLLQTPLADPFLQPHECCLGAAGCCLTGFISTRPSPAGANEGRDILAIIPSMLCPTSPGNEILGHVVEKGPDPGVCEDLFGAWLLGLSHYMSISSCQNIACQGVCLFTGAMGSPGPTEAPLSGRVDAGG